jgi:hypothetical protein
MTAPLTNVNLEQLIGGQFRTTQDSGTAMGSSGNFFQTLNNQRAWSNNAVIVLVIVFVHRIRAPNVQLDIDAELSR